MRPSFTRLKYVAEVRAGQAPPGNSVVPIDEAPGWLPFIQGNAEFGSDEPSPKLACEAPPKVAPAGAILLSVRAPVGALNHTSVPLGIGRGVSAISSRSIHPRFLWWALKATVSSLAKHAAGTTYAAVGRADAEGLRIPALPVESQAAIADFLDRECERISALQQRLDMALRIAEEILRSEVRARFQQGWREVRLRRLATSLGDGPFGSSLASEHYVDQPEVRVVRLGNIGEAEFLSRDAAYIATSYFDAELRAFAVEPGDLLIAGLGDDRHALARACVAPDTLGPAVNKADCYRARIDPRLAHPEFVAWALSFGPARDEAALLARGATRARLNTTLAADLPVPLPSLSTQGTIVASAEAGRRTLRRLALAVARMTASLAEYRDALITEAVTGQLDVTRLSDAQLDESARAAAEGEAPEVLAG